MDVILPSLMPSLMPSLFCPFDVFGHRRSIDAIYLWTKFDAVSCLSLPCRLWGKFSKFDAVFDAVSPFDAEQW